MKNNRIEIYTDGSCHTKIGIGAWAALILLTDRREILTGVEEDTTHNRMELVSVIKAIGFVANNKPEASLRIYSDSQYVCTLPDRLPRLAQNAFLTRRGTEIQNADLVKTFIKLTEAHDIEWIKIKAHQRDGSEQANHNRFVDKLSRKLVRERIVQLKFRSDLQKG
ncbi:ribonuclease H family protein [Marinilabilia rubra]|uniref:ribonuclease H family protein n=1 Tax=Marinilabilia rubra TaxID=2162893 RepID=UPI001304D2DE|nr:ribonuclease H [Marinilabilia rubra]